MFLLTTYFFGCNLRSGHYLLGPKLRYLDDREQRGWYDRMERLDGSLAPKPGPQKEGVAWAWRLTGFTPRPYSALSWWDRSVDSREGSNVIIFAPGHTVSAEDLLMLGRRDFPLRSVQRDIEIVPGWRERVWEPRKVQA